MITSPDVVALAREDEFSEPPPPPPLLPVGLGLLPSGQSRAENPWCQAPFERDFIMISEFSEQVGPQPLLTLPDHARLNFDLNYFSLRIMSVDYQASFVGHPPGTGYPKLNFVEDSKVVLGDSKEGAFAYVHHLTLYDLEARGFVRPFCMAYISADENKIMLEFQELSRQFSWASECLKTGNRKAFAGELEKKLQDLEYTRNVLHNETEIQKNSNEKGYYTSVAIEKANELANVERCIIEHQDLLMQVRTYSHKKARDSSCFSSELDCDAERRPEAGSGPDEEVPAGARCPNRRSSYTPKFTRAKSAKCFEKKLKTLEELCDVYFFTQTLEQLGNLEKSFRGDVCYLLTRQIEMKLLHQQRITSFLFEDFLAFGDEEQTEKWRRGSKPLAGHSVLSQNVVEDPCEPNVAASFESYKSCVESVPIKMEQQINPESCHQTVTDSIPCKHLQGTLDLLDIEGKEKGSISSGESIEVLGTEKSCPAPIFAKSESQPSLQCQYAEVVRRKPVITKRTNSEDSIEVLCTTESLKPEDLKAFYPSAIHEEEPAVNDGEEFGLSANAMQPVTSRHDANEFSNTNIISNHVTLSTLPEPVDSSCCIGKESPIFTESIPTFVAEYSDGVINVPPQRSKSVDKISPGDSLMQWGEDGGLTNLIADQVLTSCDRENSNLLGNREPGQLLLEDYLDSMSYISTSWGSDRTPSPALPTSPAKKLPGKRKKQYGKNALWFIRQYSFAQQAIFSLLSGRTLVVVGEQEGKVKKLIHALSMFVPNSGRGEDPIKQWVTFPLHIHHLQTWKLIGVQRIVSPVGSSVLHSLNRYSRYISILDSDNKSLRCPPYRGLLITRLADHRTQIKRGSTYYMHVNNLLTRVCSKAFLYTFCHHLHLPIDGRESEESVACRRLNFLKHNLGLMNDDGKIVQYLAELIKLHYLQEPSKGLNQVLRFAYVSSIVCKI